MEVIDGSDPSKLPGIVWTRELLLERAGFEPVKDLRHALVRDREALDAVLPEKRVHKLDRLGREYVELTEGGAPDYDKRLRAAEHVYDLADVRKRREGELGDATRPLAVTIILTGANGHAGAALQSHGVHLHLEGDNGGNGGGA